MIEAIYLADGPGHTRRKVRTASVVSGQGLVGDRNFGRTDYPGQNVTLIEAEEIESYNGRQAQDIEAWKFGRNIVTRGMRLNSLVGKTFAIGPARFKGVELCEPCAHLGRHLETDSMPAKQCVKVLVHKAGLRADVVQDGSIEEGMALVIDKGPI